MDNYHPCTKKGTTRQSVASDQPYGVWLSFDFQLWESNDYVTIRSMQGSSKQGVGGSIVHAEVGDHVRVNIRIDDSENEYRGREGYVVSLYSDNSRNSYVMNDAEQMTGDDVPSHAVYVLLDGDDVATSFSTKEVTNYSLRRRRASHTIAERPCRMGRPKLLHQEKMPVTVLVDRHILYSALRNGLRPGGVAMAASIPLPRRHRPGRRTALRHDANRPWPSLPVGDATCHHGRRSMRLQGLPLRSVRHPSGATLDIATRAPRSYTTLSSLWIAHAHRTRRHPRADSARALVHGHG